MTPAQHLYALRYALEYWSQHWDPEEMRTQPPAQFVNKLVESKERTCFWAGVAGARHSFACARDQNESGRISFLDIESFQDILMLVGPEDEDVKDDGWEGEFALRVLGDKDYFPREAKPGYRDTEIVGWHMWTLYKEDISGHSEDVHWVAAKNIVCEITRLMEVNGFSSLYGKVDGEERIIFQPKDRDNIPDEATHGWSIQDTFMLDSVARKLNRECGS